MKSLLLRFRNAIVAAALAFICFGIFVNWAAAAEPATVPDAAALTEPSVSSISVSRAISIPFGIDSPLALSSDGQHITATGPAECPAEGESYVLRVSARQSNPAALARGRTKGVCDESNETWSADAKTVAQLAFVEGEAEVCAIVVMKLDQGVGTKRWCRTVQLVTEQ